MHAHWIGQCCWQFLFGTQTMAWLTGHGHTHRPQQNTTMSQHNGSGNCTLTCCCAIVVFQISKLLDFGFHFKTFPSKKAWPSYASVVDSHADVNRDSRGMANRRAKKRVNLINDAPTSQKYSSFFSKTVLKWSLALWSSSAFTTEVFRAVQALYRVSDIKYFNFYLSL